VLLATYCTRRDGYVPLPDQTRVRRGYGVVGLDDCDGSIVWYTHAYHIISCQITSLAIKSVQGEGDAFTNGGERGTERHASFSATTNEADQIRS
jgi:hypothetical protein